MHIRHWPGDGNRPAIALHCMMGSGAYWGVAADQLAGRLDLRAPDLPGHGRSPLPENKELDYHTLVTRQVAAMIDRPLDLIGHSFGATVALRIAVGAPHAIRSLTLIEPVLFAATSDTRQATLMQMMGRMLDAGDTVGATRAFLSEWGVPGSDVSQIGPDHPFVQKIRIVAETNDVLSRDSAHILRPDGLEAVDAPVLIIRGANSPTAIGDISETLAARLPDVGQAVMPGAGHMLPITHPVELAELIGINLDRA